MEKLVVTQSRKNLIDFEIATNRDYVPNWHHTLVANELEHIEKYGDRDYKILIVSVPPRSGKSQQCSIDFPAWYLGRNPKNEIITVSYSAELAQDFGGKTREKVDSEEYKRIFPEVRLREDERARGKWKTEQGGSYTAVGVGGALTGRGANCVIGSTLIRTIKGEKKIEDIKVGERVLSLDKDNILEYNRVVAIRKSKTTKLYDVTSGNDTVRSTGEHRFFISDKGYKEAKSLQIGDKTLKIKQDLPNLQKTKKYRYKSWFKLSELLSKIKEFRYSNCLRLLREKYSQKGIRNSQSQKKRTKRSLLFFELFSETSCDKKQSSLSCLRQNSKTCKEILFSKMYAIENNLQRYFLQSLWKNFSKTVLESASILFYGLQKQFSFEGNVGTQSKLQTWNGDETLPERILQEKILNKKEYGSKMYCLSEQTKSDSSSSRSKPKKQQRREFDNSMSILSCDSSQIENNTISSITSTEVDSDVYDIQVEKNNNFFANNILVHNCILLDDVVKNREEAESETYRNNTWAWFTSTCFTRLSKGGVIVVIMTRWHLDDLAGKIIAHPDISKRIKIISLPAIAECDQLPFRKAGESLWVERFPIPVLEEIKSTVGPYDWSSLYQGSPVLTENQEFKPQWFKFKTEEEVEEMNCRRFLTVDTAMSKKTYADFTGFVDNRVNSENFWHLSAWQQKLGPEELVDTLFALHAQNRYESIGIETTTYTQGLKPYLDSEQRKRGKFLPIVELKHNQIAKEVRIRGLIPIYASGSVFHIQGQCGILEEQMRNFPFGAHDDVLDSCSYQLQIADGAKSTGVSIFIPDDIY